MKDIFYGLKFCISYFTILPVKLSNDIDVTKPSIIKSFLFFLPFIGFILASLSISLCYMLEDLEYLALLIASIFYMILYGFLHTEAIADVADALYAKHSGKDAYKIIKEPTIGAMGLLYTIVFVILKLALIIYVLKLDLFYEFIIVLVFSRLALIVNIKLFNAHEKSAFILLMKENISYIFLFLLFLFYSVIAFIFTSIDILFLGYLVVILSIISVKIIQSKLEFVNGDVLGASLEFAELISLFTIVVFMSV